MSRIVVDHPLLGTLDEGCPAAGWEDALARMGFPARLLGAEWPQPVRVFCRERLVPEGADRWMVARIALVAAGAIAILAVLVAVAVMMPWAEPGTQETLYTVNGAWTMSWRGALVLLVLVGGVTGVPLGVQFGLSNLGPRNSTSEKTRQLALAARELRARDFLAQHAGLVVLNDPSEAWLAAVAEVGTRMGADLDKAGGDPAANDRLRAALAELLARVAEAREQRASQRREAEATLRVRDGVVFLPPEFELASAVAIVDAFASEIEPYRRWLPKMPARAAAERVQAA